MGAGREVVENQPSTGSGGSSSPEEAGDQKSTAERPLPCVLKISKYLLLLNVLVGFYLMNSDTFIFFRASIFEVPKNSRLFMELYKESICFILKSKTLMEN